MESVFLAKKKVKKILNLASDKKISVVIPLRVSVDRGDAIERLKHPLLDKDFPEDLVEIVVVDDGSSDAHAQKIISSCKDAGYGYIGLDTELEYFSAARCRNIAASLLKSEFIFFQDVDLMPTHGFYNNLLNDIEIHDLNKCVNDFLMYGVVYLTDEASKEFKEASPQKKKSFFFEALDRESSKVEKISTCTSCVLMPRFSYLVRGGMYEDFNGWGYEDLEFETRIARLSKKFPLPPEWLRDIGSFSNIDTYVGWKSMLRLFGDLTWSKEGVLYHCHHKVDDNSKYKKKKIKNFELFQKYMRDFQSKGAEPEALPDLNCGRTLLFRNNVFLMNRGVRPFWGEIFVEKEEGFHSDSEFLTYLKSNKIDRVVFFNPYASEKMLQLYKCCRSNNIAYIVAERGGLSNSFFYDSNGFLSDSKSYDPALWDVELDEIKRNEITSWIRDYKDSASELEVQPDNADLSDLSKKLGVSGKKVIFVPLQRPDDTVIKYFSSNMKDYDSFIGQVQKLVEELDDAWRVVYKKHPLEDKGFDLNGAVSADDCNIRDLICLSDAVVTFNSGTGLTSLLYEKPVYVFGDAYYASKGLAYKVNSYNEVLDSLNVYTVNKESIIRFFHYLVFNFYSFGCFHTKEVVMPETGSRMTATVGIDPISIKVPAMGLSKEFNKNSIRYGFKSLMFDRYKNVINGSVAIKSANQTSKAAYRDSFHLSFSNACKLYHEARYSEAWSDIVKAIELNPKDARAKRVAAEILVNLKKRREAANYLKQARRIAPNNFAIKRRYWCLKIPVLSFFYHNKPFPVPDK
ncbi:capsular polysaccharide export protein, LipB/KpsS family [Vreelandella aquamarina]